MGKGENLPFSCNVLWPVGGCSGGKSQPAATLRGKETPPGALVPVKNILKDRVQDKALGRGVGGCFFMLLCLNSVQISLNIQYGFEQHGLTDHVQTADIYKVSSVKS